MEQFNPEIIDESIDFYGSGDALRDAKEYTSAIASAVEYARLTLQRLSNHLDRMQAIQPLTTTIPFASPQRSTVGSYIRQKSGGLFLLRQWEESFDIFLPAKIYESVPELEGKSFAMNNIGGDKNNRQYAFHEADFAPIAKKHKKELGEVLIKLYFAYDALRRIGEEYSKSKDIEIAIEAYEKVAL